MGIWNHEGDIERELRAARPKPTAELVKAIAADVRATSRRRWAVRRVGLATAMIVGMLGAFGAFGGFGYAANATSQAVRAVTGGDKVMRQVTPAQSQYGKKCGHTPATNTATKPAPGVPPGNPSNNTCPGRAGKKK